MNTDTEMIPKPDIEEDTSVTSSERRWGTNAAAKMKSQNRDFELFSAKSFDSEKNGGCKACCRFIGGPVHYEDSIDFKNMTGCECCLFSVGGPEFIMVMLFLGFMISLIVYSPSSSSELLGLFDLYGSFTRLMAMFGIGFGVNVLIQLPYAEYDLSECIMQQYGKLSPVPTALYRMCNIGIAVALVVLALKIRSGAEHIQDMGKFENVDDENVQEALTLSLAVFSTCCFNFDEGEIAPDFDCISTSNKQPCYEDVDVFEDFNSSLIFNSTLCKVEVGSSTLEGDDICGNGATEYLKLIAHEVKSRVDAIVVITIFFATLILCSATICFTTALMFPLNCGMYIGGIGLIVLAFLGMGSSVGALI